MGNRASDRGRGEGGRPKPPPSPSRRPDPLGDIFPPAVVKAIPVGFQCVSCRRTAKHAANCLGPQHLVIADPFQDPVQPEEGDQA